MAADVEMSESLFTLLYCLFSLCLIYPPKEFVSAGLCVENLFSSVLGSEDLLFIQYHIIRTSLTRFIHASIPLGYFLGVTVFYSDWNLFAGKGLIWIVACVASVALPFVIAVQIYIWRMNKWQKHPISQILSHHANGHPWYTVASSINIEMRRVDKFSNILGNTKIFVTDSWIIKTSLYSLDIAHERDLHLALEKSEQFTMNAESPGGAQFINIKVESINPAVKPFTIRVNAYDYKDLKDKIQKPISNARNIIVHQSISDRFIEAFKAEVQKNKTYEISANTELEACIGCMQTLADVKLEQQCEGNTGCAVCYCRPMWCLSCMGKWFASRQDQGQPDTWLGSQCPCPTCRARFCMLDVCKVVKH